MVILKKYLSIGSFWQSTGMAFSKIHQSYFFLLSGRAIRNSLDPDPSDFGLVPDAY